MDSEIALFWAMVAAFLAWTTCCWCPSVGTSGRFGYEPGARLQVRGHDLVWLNPLNLIHRAALTSSRFGPIAPAQFRAVRHTVRRALPRLNAFACVGYA